MAKGGTEKTKQTVKGETPKPWQNRIVGTGTEAPDQLLANPRNWRIHPQAQQEGLEAVLDRVGWVQNVVVNRSTGFMVDGHLRVTLAMRREEPEVPVVYVDLSPEEEDLILATFDPISSLAGTDRDHIAALLRGIDSHGDTALDALLEKIAEDAGLVDGLKDGEGGSGLLDGADPDAVPEPPKVPVTKPGDLWLLGDHRLLCGDSTRSEDVDRLTGGQAIDCVFTDPPYAIYGSSTGAGSDVADDKMVRPFFRDVLHQTARVLKPFGHLYICCDWRSWASWWEMARSASITPKNMIVWDKTSPGFGSNYMSQHELLFFGAMSPKEMGKMSGKQTGERMVHGVANIWQVPRAGKGETGDERQHNAQKPVALVQIGLSKSTDPGEAVLDFFGGSGTTLIAAQMEGRRAFLMEMEPKWCDLIIRRWEDTTGQKAELTRE